MSTDISTAIDWDQLFTRDVINHKHGDAIAGLGQWEYSTPKFEDDPVCGSSLWEEFLIEYEEDYYIPTAETVLAEQAALILPQYFKSRAAMGYFGIGNDSIFIRKDLKASGSIDQVVSQTAYDISVDYLSNAMEPMQRAHPNSELATKLLDIFDLSKKRTIPNADYSDARTLATMFGGTIVNGRLERDKAGNILSPEKPIRERLKAMRRFLNKGDIFAVTQDANTGKKAEKAYRGQKKFAANLAHRIKRDTPFKDIRTDLDDIIFDPRFHEGSSTVLHNLTVDFGESAGPQEMIIEGSPKIPDDEFLTWCKKEKLVSFESLKENGVYLHLLEAV